MQLSYRFWSKVRKDEHHWIWIGGMTKAGYGHMLVDSKNRQATHVAWFIYYGKWPTKDILHHCDIPSCVKRECLFEGSARDNALDRKAKDRNGGNFKLTKEQVISIRNDPRSSRKIAKDYFISQKQVLNIKHYISHKEVA